VVVDIGLNFKLQFTACIARPFLTQAGVIPEDFSGSYLWPLIIFELNESRVVDIDFVDLRLGYFKFSSFYYHYVLRRTAFDQHLLPRLVHLLKPQHVVECNHFFCGLIRDKFYLPNKLNRHLDFELLVLTQ